MKEWLVKSAKCLIFTLNFENTKHCIIFEKVNKIKKMNLTISQIQSMKCVCNISDIEIGITAKKGKNAFSKEPIFQITFEKSF